MFGKFRILEYNKLIYLKQKPKVYSFLVSIKRNNEVLAQTKVKLT